MTAGIGFACAKSPSDGFAVVPSARRCCTELCITKQSASFDLGRIVGGAYPGMGYSVTDLSEKHE
jgi:hypothetical protein